MYNTSKDYYSEFNYYAIDDGGHISKYAFDWSAYYWFAGKNISEFISLEFCFVNKAVRLSGYEITTSQYECRPISWEFSGSNNRLDWSFPSNISHSMNKTFIIKVKHIM